MTALTHSIKNCWEVYSSAKDRKAMDALAGRYLEFLSACKTERETIAYVKERLAKAGIAEGLGKTTAVFTINGKAMVIVRQGKKPLAQGLRLIGAHADTPRLDFKQHPLQEQCHIGQAKTHYYGGIRKYQWLARPLAIHGVIVKEDGTTVKVVLGEETLA